VHRGSERNRVLGAATMTAARGADLARIPPFSALSDDELNSMAHLFTVRAYPKHAIVASEGEAARVVMFIISGRTRHFWRDQHGNEMDLAILGAGESFGNVALIGEPFLVSSIVVEPLVVAAIEAQDFEALLLRHPGLAVRCLKDAFGVVRNLIQRAKVFSMEGVYGRVVWLLQRRAVASDGKLVTDRLTQADIARRVGATRESVGQVLRELARGGYITASGGRFTILRQPPARR
jgi:CRP/FNR family cyclic AMP-dependent transcriptional regulator